MSPVNGMLTPAEEAALDHAAAAHVLSEPRAAFDAVPARGTPLLARPGDFFPRAFEYTSAPENGGGRENHFQGCQLLADGVHLAVSGGDPVTRMSHLFIVRLPDEGAGPAPPGDVVARADVDAEHWHAGGIDRVGPIVAVPVECSKRGFLGRVKGIFTGDPTPSCRSDRSRILFYWLEDPTAPVRLAPEIVRDGVKATAAALTRHRNRYLVAVLSAKRLDFYFTRDGAFSSGFGDPATCPVPRGLNGCQGMNFLRSARDELLLVGHRNEGTFTPAVSKRNVANLFRVRFPGTDPGGGSPDTGRGSASTPLVEPLDAGRHFVCTQGPVDFDGGAGFDARDGALSLHTVFHFRDSASLLLRIGRFA